nr:splicing regulatory glutamine/lysine-rich protein 1 isoform X1 [Osmia lignaria]
MAKVRRNTHKSEEISSSSGSSSSISSDEEVDARDLKPIKEYLSDRRELARQLFKSVRAEKIQMMLPQTLRKMDLGQLEKWCANELSGMSKSRILSILNGKPMLDSSNTSESDDSGPSLEIISDTEEWFTDEDICVKEEGSVKGKVKKDRTKQKVKSQLHRKNDSKPNPKKASNNVSKNVPVPKEEPVTANKEKEGDSLLDLLELEMRARAIRALIRKEEDIIPNTSKSNEGNNALNKDAAAKAKQDEMKEKENCRRQLEKIISAQQNSAGEDEDVVIVVQPTPTIELLSSDSEDEPHGGVRVNKKLENERVLENKNNMKNVEEKKAANTSEVHKESDAHKTEVSKRPHSNNVSQTDTQSKSSGKRRKTKKKAHTKEQSKDPSSEVDVHNTKSSNDNQITEGEKNDECSSANVKLNRKERENNGISKEVSGTPSNINLDEEKSIDLDEIIDLDDYCDDMEEMENNENKESENKEVTGKEDKLETEVGSVKKSNGTETWASRYYQTDDVQNVIKESKIQSEIRKRLRERQRLSKASTPPNKKLQASSSTESTSNKITEQNPLGSVDEYLALKNTDATCLNVNANNDDSNVLKDSETSTDTCTDANKIIESDDASMHSENQNDETKINLSDNAIIDKPIVTNDNATDVTNPA